MNVKLFCISIIMIMVIMSAVPLQQVSAKGFIYGGQPDLSIHLRESESQAYGEFMYIPKENFELVLNDIQKLPVLFHSTIFPAIKEQLLKHESKVRDHYVQSIGVVYNMNEDTMDKNKMQIWVSSHPDSVSETVRVEPSADAKMSVIKHLTLSISVYANVTYYEYEDILSEIEEGSLQRTQILAAQAKETLNKHRDELLLSVLEGEGSLANKIRIQGIFLKMMDDIARVSVTYPQGKEGLKFIDEAETGMSIRSLPEFQFNSITLGEPEIVTEDSTTAFGSGYTYLGQELIIQSELRNTITNDMNFTYIVQVKDRNGIMVSLNSSKGSLASNESIRAAISWIPESPGRYEIETFVWGDPLTVALSESRNTSTTIINDRRGVENSYDKEQAARSFEIRTTQDSPEIRVSLNQGESIELPLQIRLVSENYGMLWMQLSLEGLPSNVHAWIAPNELSRELSGTINSGRSINATVPIYTVSDTQPGNYTLKIIGGGNMIDLLTGDTIGIGSELGLINLEIKPKSSPITIDIERAKTHRTPKFCVYFDSSSYTCDSLVSYKEYRVTVYSEERTDVKLNVITPKGVWVKLVPEQLHVGPDGATASMMVSGGVDNCSGPTGCYQLLFIQAESPDGKAAIESLTIRKTHDLTVLHSPGPIEFPQEIVTSGVTQFGMFGAVYDPDESSDDSLSVNLSVLGLFKDGKILPLPSWLEVDIPNPSFSLNASQPHYFLITAGTSSSQVGVHTVVIEEIIDGERFTQNLQIRVTEPTRL